MVRYHFCQETGVHRRAPWQGASPPLPGTAGQFVVHSAAVDGALQFSAVFYSVLQCSAVFCSVLRYVCLYSAVRCSARPELCTAEHNGNVQCSGALQGLCSTVLQCCCSASWCAAPSQGRLSRCGAQQGRTLLQDKLSCYCSLHYTGIAVLQYQGSAVLQYQCSAVLRKFKSVEV